MRTLPVCTLLLLVSCGADPTGILCHNEAADHGQQHGPLLVTDSDENKIYELDFDGTVLREFASPVANVMGVTHDQRFEDGFWVIGTAEPDRLFKLDWQGAVVETVSIGRFHPEGDVRGLDYQLVNDPQVADHLVVVHENKNHWIVLSGFSRNEGEGYFSAGLASNRDEHQDYWGVALEVSFPNPGPSDDPLHYCSTYGRTIECRTNMDVDYQTPIDIDRPLGLTADRGGYYIVDGDAPRIVKLNPSGNFVEEIPTPGEHPAGISVWPKPSMLP